MSLTPSVFFRRPLDDVQRMAHSLSSVMGMTLRIRSWAPATVICLAVIGASNALADPAAVTQGWPSFRGGDAQGVVEGRLPPLWTDADYRWTFPLQGMDVGSPVVTADDVDGEPYVFLTDRSQDGQSIRLLAIGLRSGEPKWQQSFPLEDRRRHQRNSPASTTPAIDGSQVYVAHGDAGGASLRAYTYAGELVWQRDLGSWTGYHGFGGSPIVIDDRVILFNSQQTERLESFQVPGKSFMMAFDRQTGATVWSTPLTTTRTCYGVPAPYDVDGQSPQLIAANTGDGVFSLDVATGQKLWSLSVFDKRCCSSPVIFNGSDGHDLVMASCGSGGGGNVLSVVKIPDDDGQPEELFRVKSNAPYVPTPCVKDGLIFMVSDNGVASCWDSDGNRVWMKRLGGKFGSSPVIVGQQMLVLSLDGDATVISADRQGHVGETFSLGTSLGASPAVADGQLLIRVDDRLACLSLTRN
ncbi:MAG: PQQ-binding-like beta-propeller repeat protein [Planctomycetota bacterium]